MEFHPRLPLLINDNLDLNSSRRICQGGNNGTNFIPVVEQSSKKFRKSLAPMTHFYDFCGCALKALTSMSTTHIYSYLS